ncbi:hypothetical protein ACQ4PT_047054 [Festuca glaucescens]
MDCEFFAIINDASSDKLSLPKKFADLLEGREPRELKLREMLPMKFAELLKGRVPRGLKLREADDPSSSPWDVDVLFDAAGCIYLGRGWEQFARNYCLQRGSFLLFSFDGDALLTVKVFKLDMCRRHYYYDHDASTSSETSPDPSTDEESTDEESTDEESMDGDDPFDSSIIVSQRADLDDDEKDHIRELLPQKMSTLECHM